VCVLRTTMREVRNCPMSAFVVHTFLLVSGHVVVCQVMWELMVTHVFKRWHHKVNRAKDILQAECIIVYVCTAPHAHLYVPLMYGGSLALPGNSRQFCSSFYWA